MLTMYCHEVHYVPRYTTLSKMEKMMAYKPRFDIPDLEHTVISIHKDYQSVYSVLNCHRVREVD